MMLDIEGQIRIRPALYSGYNYKVLWLFLALVLKTI